ncbi:hypothetical protein [Porphyromonas sp. COT-290 OH860]|uniref:hypothetical protein n=1 Tax=Porphyromonas sp. COT-290 OH860 TaxID=1515615 RepID=UPI0005C7A561|nr:hypothetical protein [Porphyromonas sp. COT-290 OH860]
MKRLKGRISEIDGLTLEGISINHGALMGRNGQTSATIGAIVSNNHYIHLYINKLTKQDFKPLFPFGWGLGAQPRSDVI